MSWFRRNGAHSTAATIASSPSVTHDTPTLAPMPFASTMMDFQLTVQHIFDRASTLFADRELVTLTAEGSERSTYGASCKRAKQLAAALDALGIKRGDRVATLGWNTTRHFELYMAAPCMGAVLHTLNLRLPTEQLNFVISDASDKVIFVDADLFPLLEKSVGFLDSVEHIVVMNGPMPVVQGNLPPVLDYEKLIASAPAGYDWPHDLDEREACAMCYTSGTTGNPKGVVYSHRSTFLHATSVTQADTLALSNRDTSLPIVPMFHVNAWGVPHAAAMVGSKMVFPGRFMVPDRIVQAMVDEGVTISAGVPTIWLGVLQYLEKHPEIDVSKVTRLVCGGSAAPASLIAALDKRGLRLVHAWGMTETSPIGTVAQLKASLDGLSPEEQLVYRAKQGYPVPGVEIRIMNLETERVLPWDGVAFGEIQIRGPWITGGYYHDANAEQGQSKFMDGWFRTGDVATIDPEGYIQIVDRTKDVIKSGGEWISSVQLEGLIMGHPKVLEAAVIGLPHPKWDERPVALVVPKPGETVTETEIRDYLTPLVNKIWLPDRVIMVESLDKTSVGKFDKKVMRKRFAEQVDFSK